MDDDLREPKSLHALIDERSETRVFDNAQLFRDELMNDPSPHAMSGGWDEIRRKDRLDKPPNALPASNLFDDIFRSMHSFS